MKKSFTTEAINLKNYPLNDNDSVVVMFSKTKGLMHAIAKGSKRPKSKLGARVQMFIANKLMLFEGRNFDTIAQAQSVNTFSKIRTDIEKLSYSMYIAELVNTFCSRQFNEDENYSEIYDLIFAAYEKIAKSEDKKEVLLALLKFQLKFITYCGFGIDFCFCSKCQKKLDNGNKSSFFSYSQKSFLCDNCIDIDGGGVRIHNKIRLFLDEIQKVNFKEKTKYDDIVTFVVLERCFSFIKKYIESLANKKTKIFDVLEKIG